MYFNGRLLLAWGLLVHGGLLLQWRTTTLMEFCYLKFRRSSVLVIAIIICYILLWHYCSQVFMCVFKNVPLKALKASAKVSCKHFWKLILQEVVQLKKLAKTNLRFGTYRARNFFTGANIPWGNSLILLLDRYL